MMPLKLQRSILRCSSKSLIVVKLKETNIQYNMMLFYILIMLATSCVCAYLRRIELFPYRQEDSETNCEHGLISDKDTVVFIAEVSGDIQKSSVYFQRKSKSDSMYLLFKDIVINGTFTDENFSWKSIRPHVAQVTIKEKAKTENSGARIQGVLVSLNKDPIYSEEQIYPDIRESTDLKIRMLINGVETLIQNNCDIHGDGSDIVMYECQGKASPCWIKISADDLMTPLTGKGYVQHISKLREQNVTITYSSCTLNGTINTLKCHLKRDILDAKVSNEESNANTLNSLTAPLGVSIIINFGFLITIVWGRYRRRILRIFSCIKPKTENDIDGNSAIEDTTVTVNDGTNSPIIQVGTSIDTDVDGETDRKGERLPLIRNTSNRKRHKDEEQGNASINSSGGLSCPGEEEKHRNESIISMEALAGPDHCRNTEKEEANRFNDVNEIMTQSGNPGKDNSLSMEAVAFQSSLLANGDHYTPMDQPGNKTDMSNTLINQHITQPEPDNSESLSNRRIYQTNNQEEILHDLNILRKSH